MLGALKGQPVLQFPEPANITGTEPVLPQMYDTTESSTAAVVQAVR
jgi:hypothetical protein